MIQGTITALLFLPLMQEAGTRALTPEQREKQLATRVPPGLLRGSTPDSFASSAYAISDVLLTWEAKVAAEVRLINPFPESYKPTWKEILETLARQTQTSWSYSEKEATWLFKKPALPLPFTIKLAKGWTQEDRGSYAFFKPPKADVGMDIYLLGTYSFEKEAEKELLKVRDSLAVEFFEEIVPAAKLEDMTKVRVGGAEALYLESKVRMPGVIWRQWVFAGNGGVCAIVSALDEDQVALLKDVREMVGSFKFAAGKKDEKKDK